MSEPRLRGRNLGAMRIRVAELGEGPLVLLCHGFPRVLAVVVFPALGARRRGIWGHHDGHARLRRNRRAA